MTLKNFFRLALGVIALGMAIAGLSSLAILPAILLCYSYAKPGGMPIVR